MRIVDGKIRHNVSRYVFQSALATLAILTILIFLDVLSHTAIIATLGSTAFIVFTMPKSYPSRPRPLIGGYAFGVSVGCFCSFLSTWPPAMSMFHRDDTSLIVFAALAVGIAIFLMVLTNTEHAPAAGMALGLVLNTWDYRTIIFILSAVLLLTIVKRLLKPILIDLI